MNPVTGKCSTRCPWFNRNSILGQNRVTRTVSFQMMRSAALTPPDHYTPAVTHEQRHHMNKMSGACFSSPRGRNDLSSLSNPQSSGCHRIVIGGCCAHCETDVSQHASQMSESYDIIKLLNHKTLTTAPYWDYTVSPTSSAALETHKHRQIHQHICIHYSNSQLAVFETQNSPAVAKQLAVISVIKIDTKAGSLGVAEGIVLTV